MASGCSPFVFPSLHAKVTPRPDGNNWLHRVRRASGCSPFVVPSPRAKVTPRPDGSNWLHKVQLPVAAALLCFPSPRAARTPGPDGSNWLLIGAALLDSIQSSVPLLVGSVAAPRNWRAQAAARVVSEYTRRWGQEDGREADICGTHGQRMMPVHGPQLIQRLGAQYPVPTVLLSSME